MPRYVNPNRFVTFVRDHVQVQPATVLCYPETGEVIAEIPERRDTYVHGQELQFGSVNAARAFVKAVNCDKRPIVCVLGKV